MSAAETGMDIDYTWRGDFTNAEVNALHAQAFEHRLFADDWVAQVNRYSLGWVTARVDGVLVGFVNVAWDGGVHAFVLDTMTARTHARQGVATRLIEVVVEHARQSPCEWLHVDFDEHLRPFYFQACGFTSTNAGLIALDG